MEGDRVRIYCASRRENGQARRVELSRTADRSRDGYERIAGYFAFYASKMDACYVGGERVRPQPGGYYGGWVTSNLTGPIKGEPGTENW